MHKINRASVDRPACLEKYDWKLHRWEDLEQQDKRLLRLRLQAMQAQGIIDDLVDDEAHVILGLCCAYCESQIYSGGHIEHFRRKNKAHFPHLTFEWTNLFISCDSQKHCGHYKDRKQAQPYNPDQLLKPDEHDPNDYLYFYSSGEVRVREHDSMSADDRCRGTETIRVFGLNEATLKGDRLKALNTYKNKNIGITEFLMTCNEDERAYYINGEIEANKELPHLTIIRHFFEKAHP